MSDRPASRAALEAGAKVVVPLGQEREDEKIKPTGAVARGARFLWSVTFDAFRDFVWGDLKDGVLDLHGLTLPVRALVWLGFILLLVMTGAMLGQLTGDLGLVGLDRFGRPMLYAMIAATLALPLMAAPTAEELGVDTPDEDVIDVGTAEAPSAASAASATTLNMAAPGDPDAAPFHRG
jgi:hypothetical protein